MSDKKIISKKLEKSTEIVIKETVHTMVNGNYYDWQQNIRQQPSSPTVGEEVSMLQLLRFS